MTLNFFSLVFSIILRNNFSIPDCDVIIHTAAVTPEKNKKKISFKWVFECAAAADDTNYGAFTSWTKPKSIKLQGREYSSSHQVELHNTYYWDGASAAHFSAPMLTITAYS